MALVGDVHAFRSSSIVLGMYAGQEEAWQSLGEFMKLAELQRIGKGDSIDDELMSNIELITEIVNSLYIKTSM